MSTIDSQSRVAENPERIASSTSRMHGSSSPACWNTIGMASMPGPLMLFTERTTDPKYVIVFAPRPLSAGFSCCAGMGTTDCRSGMRSELTDDRKDSVTSRMTLASWMLIRASTRR
eukprot:Amastigsp_a509313_87.p4 type:complete len:116 gc:universal Amastigsp_a509313_87:370-23(-)